MVGAGPELTLEDGTGTGAGHELTLWANSGTGAGHESMLGQEHKEQERLAGSWLT